MPKIPESNKPPAPSDCYIVVGLWEHPDSDIWGSTQVWVIAASSEEEAVQKVSPESSCQQFVALIAPVFPRVGEVLAIAAPATTEL